MPVSRWRCLRRPLRRFESRARRCCGWRRARWRRRGRIPPVPQARGTRQARRPPRRHRQTLAVARCHAQRRLIRAHRHGRTADPHAIAVVSSRRSPRAARACRLSPPPPRRALASIRRPHPLPSLPLQRLLHRGHSHRRAATSRAPGMQRRTLPARVAPRALEVDPPAPATGPARACSPGAHHVLATSPAPRARTTAKSGCGSTSMRRATPARAACWRSIRRARASRALLAPAPPAYVSLLPSTHAGAPPWGRPRCSFASSAAEVLTPAAPWGPSR